MAAPEHIQGGSSLPITTTVLLYGGLFAAPAPPGTHGIRSFATGQVVQTEAIVQMMFAVALAHLHQRNAVVLRQFQRKRFRMFTVSGVEIDRVSQAPVEVADPVGRAALKPTRKGDPRTVGAVVARMVPRSKHPYLTVVQAAVDQAVRLGYLQRSRSGGVLGFGAHREVEPVADKLAVLEPMADELLEEWLAFRDADGDLATALRFDIGKAVASRVERAEGGEEEDWTDDSDADRRHGS
jgi:hypothetical protein